MVNIGLLGQYSKVFEQEAGIHGFLLYTVPQSLMCDSTIVEPLRWDPHSTRSKLTSTMVL